MLQRRAEKSAEVPVVLPEMFGADHERLLLFIEGACVGGGGYPDIRFMSCNQARHPERAGDGGRPPWRDAYSTKLRDGTAVSGHDDWDSVEDFIAAGLVKWHGTGAHPRIELTESGWARAHELRRERAKRGLRA